MTKLMRNQASNCSSPLTIPLLDQPKLSAQSDYHPLSISRCQLDNNSGGVTATNDVTRNNSPGELFSHEDSRRSRFSFLKRFLVDSREPQTNSKNIQLTLYFTFISTLWQVLWNMSVLPAYAFLLWNDTPETVGFITGMMGLSQLICAFPAGVLADHYRRDSVLKLGSVAGLIGLVMMVCAVLSRNYIVLCTALAILGSFRGMSSTCLSALFADSVLVGERSKFFTQRVILGQIGGAMGPVVALGMFLALGDEWTIEDCTVVILTAQIVGLPAMLLLWFLNDDYAVTTSKDNQDTRSDDEADATCQTSKDECLKDTCIVHAGNDITDEESVGSRLMLSAEGREITVAMGHDSGCCLSKNTCIAVTVAASDIIAGLAAGMSIRYFPIFFLDNLKLEPASVQVLYILSQLGMVVMSRLAHLGGLRIGRCQMTVVHKWIGVFLLFSMVASFNQNMPKYLTCTIYVLRTSFMNSTNALTRSVLMDVVPRNERGKWSALESVTMFSWSGSAAFGGVLVASKGILFNFHVTALLQILATLPLILLFKRVPREK